MRRFLVLAIALAQPAAAAPTRLLRQPDISAEAVAFVYASDVWVVPWDGANDHCPVWLGNTVYFLSDRDLAVNLWAYNLETEALTQLTHFADFDAKNLAGGAGMLVFE